MVKTQEKKDAKHSSTSFSLLLVLTPSFSLQPSTLPCEQNIIETDCSQFMHF